MKDELLNQLEKRKIDRTKSVIKNYRSIDAEPRVMNNSSSVVNDMRQQRGAEDMYAVDYGAKQKNPRSMMESYALAKPQSYGIKP
jgi:hypothetical protein